MNMISLLSFWWPLHVSPIGQSTYAKTVMSHSRCGKLFACQQIHRHFDCDFYVSGDFESLGGGCRHSSSQLSDETFTSEMGWHKADQCCAPRSQDLIPLDFFRNPYEPFNMQLLASVWNEIDHHFDWCRITSGAHIGIRLSDIQIFESSFSCSTTDITVYNIFGTNFWRSIDNA